MAEKPTFEDLLTPRVKLIALVPFCLFDVGRVLYETGKKRHYIFMERVLPLEWFEKYPHLFEVLPWWKDRKIEDMPGYLKSETGNVRKVIEHWAKGKKDLVAIQRPEGVHVLSLYSRYNPATEEEYLNQNP